MNLFKKIKKPTIYISLQKWITKQIAMTGVFIKRIYDKIPVRYHFINLLRKLPHVKKITTRRTLDQSPWNYIILLASSLLISLIVFYFMSFLISKGKNPKLLADQNLSIEFLLNTPKDELELRSRRLPKKPKEEKPPPEIPKLKIQQTKMEKPDLSSHLPKLDLPDDFVSDNLGAAVAAQGIRDSTATPIFQIRPVYPRRARMKSIEGFVLLSFDITETGQTDNISVLQASPPQIFNSSAIQALRKWKFKAKTEDGKPVRQKNQRINIKFELSK